MRTVRIEGITMVYVRKGGTGAPVVISIVSERLANYAVWASNRGKWEHPVFSAMCGQYIGEFLIVGFQPSLGQLLVIRP